MNTKLNLYNTLNNQIMPFETHEPGVVRMYTCGPTVYHFAHIGNLRTYIMEDVLEKFLRFIGYRVDRCMNITDVGHLSSDADEGEDKMVKGAKREHKTVLEIAQMYTDAFFSDCDKLNIRKPDIVVPATSMIPEFIEMVQTLLDKGYAYQAAGNVYFDTTKLDNYYTLTNHNQEDLATGVREGVEEDTAKRSKTDFVLWFTKSKFEDQALKWDSPWGIGYPGWHIECSAISIKNLGEYLDLHCGGIDNVFPHHTNEIAQSEAYLGHSWCSHWYHVLHLNDETGKMSKSKGEFLTVSLLESKGYDPMVYRMFCLQSHYRKPLMFSYEVMDNVANTYNKLVARIRGLEKEGVVDEAAKEAFCEKFAEAVAQDINTSMGITILYDVLKADLNGATKRAIIAAVDEVLSLNLIQAADAEPEASAEDADLEAYVLERIEARKAAKKAKDFATADAIRAELLEKGIVLKDTREGTLWSKA